jgi:hypothetical protein
MALFIVLALLIVLDVAALLWGKDSRDGPDWDGVDSWARRPQPPRARDD